VSEWGLWNQPELLSTVVYRRTDTPEELAEVVTATDEALMLAQDLGGSMEYVHGAGVRYAHLMAREHGRGLDLLRALKHALDPEHLLNPGKLGL
jgi:D-lactate dehydrogenase (cytochrome)